MLVWVVGARGLLGASVAGALAERPGFGPFIDDERVPGKVEAALDTALRARVARFLAESIAWSSRGFAVLWCAGATVVASGPREVAADCEAFDRFLAALDAALDGNALAARAPGHVILASSAGGLWAGQSGGPPVTESTPVRPLSDYGFGHFAREAALAAFAARRSSVRSVTLRLSNLYGPAQRLDKAQGLVSQIARSLIYRKPIRIYVPLDTVRDYLFAADAGRGVVDVLERLARSAEAESTPLVKILASEEETSVGGLLAVFRHVTRRRVAVVAGLSPLGRLQPSRLRFRSEVWTSVGRGRRTLLPEGVASIHRYLLAQYTRGALPPPVGV